MNNIKHFSCKLFFLLFLPFANKYLCNILNNHQQYTHREIHNPHY